MVKKKAAKKPRKRATKAKKPKRKRLPAPLPDSLRGAKLIELRMSTCTASFNLRDGHPLPSKIEIGFGTKSTALKEKKLIVVAFRIAVTAKYEDTPDEMPIREFPIVVHADYRLGYNVPSTTAISKQALEQFAEEIAERDVWPRFRALVAEISSQMGIPMLPLDLEAPVG